MKRIIYVLMALLMVVGISALSLERAAPSSVTTGNTFVIRYNVVGGIGNFGVLASETVTGGCEPAEKSFGFIDSGTGAYKDVTYTAPTTPGTCTFNGNYQFADETGTLPEASMSALSIPVNSGTCIPTCTGKSCGDDNGCGGKCTVQTCQSGYSCVAGACTNTTPAPQDNTILYIVIAAVVLIVIMGVSKKS